MPFNLATELFYANPFGGHSIKLAWSAITGRTN